MRYRLLYLPSFWWRIAGLVLFFIPIAGMTIGAFFSLQLALKTPSNLWGFLPLLIQVPIVLFALVFYWRPLYKVLIYVLAYFDSEKMTLTILESNYTTSTFRRSRRAVVRRGVVFTGIVEVELLDVAQTREAQRWTEPYFTDVKAHWDDLAIGTVWDARLHGNKVVLIRPISR